MNSTKNSILSPNQALWLWKFYQRGALSCADPKYRIWVKENSSVDTPGMGMIKKLFDMGVINSPSIAAYDVTQKGLDELKKHYAL